MVSRVDVRRVTSLGLVLALALASAGGPAWARSGPELRLQPLVAAPATAAERRAEQISALVESSRVALLVTGLGFVGRQVALSTLGLPAAAGTSMVVGATVLAAPLMTYTYAGLTGRSLGFSDLLCFSLVAAVTIQTLAGLVPVLGLWGAPLSAVVSGLMGIPLLPEEGGDRRHQAELDAIVREVARPPASAGPRSPDPAWTYQQLVAALREGRVEDARHRLQEHRTHAARPLAPRGEALWTGPWSERTSR